MQSFCLSIEGIRKDYLFREKWYVKQGNGLDLGAGPPHTKICWVPPSSPGVWLWKDVNVIDENICGTPFAG